MPPGQLCRSEAAGDANAELYASLVLNAKRLHERTMLQIRVR